MKITQTAQRVKTLFLFMVIMNQTGIKVRPEDVIRVWETGE